MHRRVVCQLLLVFCLGVLACPGWAADGSEAAGRIEIWLGSAHPGGFERLAFSPDGRVVAAAKRYAAVSLWDTRSGKEFAVLKASGRVGCVQFSPAGDLFACGAGKAVQLWDPTNWREVRTLTGHTGDVQALSFSADGRLVATGGADRAVKLWDVATGRELRTLLGHSQVVSCLAFSPDGKLIVSGDDDKSVRLWRVENGQALRSLSEGKAIFIALTFDEDGRTVVGADLDKHVSIWEVATGRQAKQFVLPEDCSLPRVFGGAPMALAVVSENGDGWVALWDVAQGREIGRLPTGRRPRTDGLAFSADGAVLACGDSKGRITLWDLKARVKLKTFATPLVGVQAVSFHKNGLLATLVGNCRTADLWDVARGQLVKSLSVKEDEFLAAFFTSDGHARACAWWNEPWESEDNVIVGGLVKLWDIETGKAITEFRVSQDARCASLSPDGKMLAVGLQNTIDLRSFPTGKLVCELKGGERLWFIRALAFRPDGRILANTSHTLWLWDVVEKRELRMIQEDAASAAFSPDGKLLAGGAGNWLGTVKVWDAESGKEMRVLSGHTDRVGAVTFSPDGDTIASASDDCSVRLWRVKEGAPLRTLQEHCQPVSSVMYTSDGRLLITGSMDGTVKFWNPKDGSLLVTLAAIGDKGDYLAWTPDGFYLGTPGAEKEASVRTGLKLEPLTDHHDRYYNPDKVLAKLKPYLEEK